MRQMTKENYLSKRLIRLLKKQQLELSDEHGWSEAAPYVPGHLREVRRNIKHIINIIENNAMTSRMVTESFVIQVLHNTDSQYYSQRAATHIIMDTVNTLHADEFGQAHKEYVIDMSKIRWVTKAERKRRLNQRRNRAV